MKNYALLAAAALGMLAACSKNETVPQQPGTDPVDDGSPVAVQFNATPMASVATRAGGSVGDFAGASNVWGNQTLYVFGFDRDITDFTDAETTAFIWHVSAAAPAGAETGGIDVYNPQFPDEPFYYGDDIYDFYGYHIDDAYLVEGSEVAPEPVSEANRIYVPFKIDGGQDLMVAKADPAADVVGTEVTAQNAYSAYAARRDVHPNLLFKHQLARFKFEVRSGDPSADNIQIDSIKLQSRTTGNLVVVGAAGVTLGIADTTSADALSWIELRQKAGDVLEALDPVEVPTYVSDQPVQESVSAGESILAMPGVAQYRLRVVLSDKTGQMDTPIESQEYDLTAASLTNADGDSMNATKFEAGKSYKVTIVVRGPQDVQIEATVEAWEDGGETVIDPDQPPFGN